MKRPILAAVALSLMVSCSLPVQAQTASSLMSNPYFARRQALEDVTAKLGAALQKGDEKGVVALLAPDFELGHLQYQWRDPAWMEQALARNFKQWKYTKFDVALGGDEGDGDVAFVSGRYEIQATYQVSSKDAHRDYAKGDYTAVWRKTGAGWKLERADGLFRPILNWEPLLASTSLVSPSVARSRINGASMPLQEPMFVLQQPALDFVDSLNFSPDGEVVATAYGGSDLHFSSAKTGALLKGLDAAFVMEATYAPDGTLVTQDLDDVDFRDGRNGAIKFSLSEPDVIASLCVSPDGRTLALKAGKKVQLWDVAGKRRMQAFGELGDSMGPLQFSRDNRTLAVLGQGGVELWDLRENKKILSTGDSRAWFLADGKTVVTGSGSRLRFWAIGSEAVTREVKIPSELPGSAPLSGDKSREVPVLFFPASEVTLAPNGKIAARIYPDGSIGIWDVETLTLLRGLRGFQGESVVGRGDIPGKNTQGLKVSALAFSPDSQTLAVGSYTGEAALWDVSF